LRFKKHLRLTYTEEEARDGKKSCLKIIPGVKETTIVHSGHGHKRNK
jgi:hypothetical protein